MDSDIQGADARLSHTHVPPQRPQPSLLDDLCHGLLTKPRTLPPKYFYDARGAELFEAICATQDYYPTRSETALLQAHAAEIMAAAAPDHMLELGAGSARKTRHLLAAAAPGLTYWPFDVSQEMLLGSAAGLVADFPALNVHALVGDYHAGLEQLPWPSDGRRMAVFLGGTIGNFPPEQAAAFVCEIADTLRVGDTFLLGADRVKDAAVLERAYDDSDGVTAAFNRNMLTVLNARTGSNFDPEQFGHRSWYNAQAQQVEMHLDARSAHDVHIPQVGNLTFAAGESIRTEISRKFSAADLRMLCEHAGLTLEHLWTTPEPHSYSLLLARKG